MSCNVRMSTAIIAAIGGWLAAVILPAAAQGHEFGKVLRGLAAPVKAAHRQPPATPSDPCVEDLAARIDWLEHHLDCYGSIVAKQPDVWGQSRLTRHRVEYEEQMRRQLGLFTERTSAAIRTSDQAFLGMALAVQSASGRRRTTQEGAVPEAVGSASVINSIQGLIPTTNEAAGRADPIVIARTAPFGFPQNLGYQFRGYDLDAARRPTFRYEYGEVKVDDRFEDRVDDAGAAYFRRTIQLTAPAGTAPFHFRVAAGTKVTATGPQAYAADKLRIRLIASPAAVLREGEVLIPLTLPSGTTTLTLDYQW